VNSKNHVELNQSPSIDPAADAASPAARVPADPTPYNDVEAAAFWPLYARVSQPAIERACRGFSRSLTDNAMSDQDMTAWVDDRVWKMQREGKWPVFHDHPTPETAAARLADKARLLARWAYVALSRKTFRRKAREASHLREMSRAEKLACVSRTDADLERLENVNASLDSLRSAISEKTRMQVAASWQDADERRRVAMELGLDGDAVDEMMDRVESGEIRANTLDQMRSRSRREIRGVLGGGFLAGLLMLLSVMAVTFAAPSVAQAGEQTGGRPGGKRTDAGLVIGADHALRGEQTGGRPG